MTDARLIGTEVSGREAMNALPEPATPEPDYDGFSVDWGNVAPGWGALIGGAVIPLAGILIAFAVMIGLVIRFLS